MKFSMACVVLAAVAAAAPARAGVLTDNGETSFLIKTQTLIKKVEENYSYFLPALTDLARELHQGLNSDMFSISNGIRNTFVDVNIKVRQINENANAILSQIELVASSSGTFNHSNARSDFDMKRNSFKQFFEKTFNVTNIVRGLIDETKELLRKGVSGPLKMLQRTVLLVSDDKLTHENANIRRQQMTIDNPPRVFLYFTDHQAVRAAQAMKRQSETTVRRIEQLVATILDHVKWLEGVCQTIREELDNKRTDMSTLDDKIRKSKVGIDNIIEGLVYINENLSDEEFDVEYRFMLRPLVDVMNQLRFEVQIITRTRNRRATDGQDYNMVPYQMETDESFTSDFLQQSNRPSWLDKTADNGCFYIYNNRTAGCIFVKTFDAMKEQYTSLSDKFLEFDGLFRNYDKELKNVATQVVDRSKNTTYQMDAIKFASDLETKKVLWSDNVKKIRDLSTNLNAYAESLFSAQLFIKRNKDQRLNNDITRFVDEMEKVAMDILSKNINDILGINHQVADILSRVKINVACVEEQKTAPNAYNRF